MKGQARLDLMCMATDELRAYEQKLRDRLRRVRNETFDQEIAVPMMNELDAVTDELRYREDENLPF